MGARMECVVVVRYVSVKTRVRAVRETRWVRMWRGRRAFKGA